MATYYVSDELGNDGWDGLSPTYVSGTNGPKASLNGAEDIPVAAGDFVWVHRGVYRELLTCDVSGGAGTEIIYQGDVAGEIWDKGGVVRVTGSDDDQSATRANCVYSYADDYRTFRGFFFDGATSHSVHGEAVSNWIIEDCTFGPCNGGQGAIYFEGSAQLDNTVRRCFFFVSGNLNRRGVCFSSGTAVADASSLVENCTFVGGEVGVGFVDVGGVTVRNCGLLGNRYAVRSHGLTPGYTAITINNSIVYGCLYGPYANALGEIVEDFNEFIANWTDRTNVAVGGNSVSYLALFQPPLFHAGAGQASGYRLPWWFGELSQWSQVRAITGTGEPSVDLLGIGRPATASKCSWGAVQYQGVARETTVVPTGADESVKLADAARLQVMRRFEPGGTLNVQVRVYREADYAGTAPQMVIKQPGQADVTVTDSGSASQWNTLSRTFTPASEPEFFVVELVSNNTATSGSYATYFQGLSVS